MIALPHDPLYRALWLIIFSGWGITTFFFAKIMSRALMQIDPALRRMRPEYCWLTFIPFFGIGWQFLVANAVTLGLRDEFMRRNYIPREPKPGFASGLSANILFCFVLFPPAGLLITISSFIPRIIHFIRIRNYTSELARLIEIQNQYAAQEQAAAAELAAIVIPAEQNSANTNPERFQRPMTEEEIWERWRKKD